MQETLDLKRQAKSKSQNPLIKQRKNRRSETTVEVAVASDKWLGFEEGFGKGEIGEGFYLGLERASARVRSERASGGFGFSV